MLRLLHSRVLPRTAPLLTRTMSAATATSAPIAAAAGATPVSWTRTDGSAVPGYAFGKVVRRNIDSLRWRREHAWLLLW